MSTTALSTQFSHLSGLLDRYQALWRSHAFYLTEMPWQPTWPQLYTRLQKLDMAHAETLQADDDALSHWLEQDLPEFAELRRLIRLPMPPVAPMRPVPTHFARDIPGRKWRQVQAFVASCHRGDKPLPLLEWCGGKGHLGRLACQQWQVDGLSMDFDADLVIQGQALSERLNLPLNHREANALQDSGRCCVQREQQALALHACGGLHLALIDAAIAANTRRLFIAPCCYHLHQPDQYQPQSQQGRQLNLNLSSADLRSAVQQTATAPMRVRRQRKQMQAWRQGFDRLQRWLRGVDEYLPVPSLPASLCRGSFAEFCAYVAAHKQLVLPANLDWAHWEREGWRRLEWITSMDLVRMGFRRALELWLVLDRALKLEEAGYRVELGEFCEPSLTPRNILISARLDE